MSWNWSTPLTSTWESAKYLAVDCFYKPCIEPVTNGIANCLAPCYQPVANFFQPVAKKAYPILEPSFKFLVNFFEPAVRLALLVNHLFSLALKSDAISPEAETITKDYRAFVEISFGLIAAIILTYSQTAFSKKTSDDEDESAELASSDVRSIKDMPGIYKSIRYILKMAEAMYGISTLTEYLSTMMTFILKPAGFYIATGIAFSVGIVRVMSDNYKPFLLTDPASTEAVSLPSTEGSTWGKLIKEHFSSYTTESSKTINMFMFLYQYLAGFSREASLRLRFTVAMIGMAIASHSFYWAANRDKKPSIGKDEEHHRASQAREIISTGALSAYALSGLDLVFQGLNHSGRPEKSGYIPNWLVITFGLFGLFLGAHNASKLPRVIREYYVEKSTEDALIEDDSSQDTEIPYYMRPATPPSDDVEGIKQPLLRYSQG